VESGRKHQLYGSVTCKDIADALAAQNYTIDRHLLDDLTKQLSEYKVPPRFQKNVGVG
jgi:ribosomal protein L9